MLNNVAAEQLKLLLERIERLEEEKKGISDDIKDVYLEGEAIEKVHGKTGLTIWKGAPEA